MRAAKASAFAAALVAAGAAAAAPPLPSPGQASAPAAASAPQGAPFPVMVRPAQGAAAAVQIPSATERMSLEQPRTDATLQRMGSQVDERLAGLRLGSGEMAAPDVAPYRSDLLQMSEEQRQIKLLQLKQQRADLAMKLWSTVYDPRREEEAARGTVSAASTGSASTGAPAQAATPALAADAKAAQERREAEDYSKRLAEQPFPKIASVDTVMVNAKPVLVATLLVPYVGEVPAVPGTDLPGGRRVLQVTAKGVIVRDKGGARVALGFGDSVPLVPPTAAAPMPMPQPARQAASPGFPGASAPGR